MREVRRRGFMVGIELEGFPLEARIGHRVTLEARARGAIVRPLGDTVVLMPPLSIQPAELRRLVEITAAAIAAAAGARRPSPRPPEHGGRRQRGQRGAAARPRRAGAGARRADRLEARAGLRRPR